MMQSFGRLTHIWGDDGDLHFDMADVVLIRVVPNPEIKGSVLITMHFNNKLEVRFGTDQVQCANLIEAHSKVRNAE